LLFVEAYDGLLKQEAFAASISTTFRDLDASSPR